MPGPNIRNRAAEEKKSAAIERQTYYLTDPKCDQIHGLDVTDAMRENGVILTASEAMTLVASGAVTTNREDAEKAREAQTKSHNALMQRQAEDAEAAALAAEAAADAAQRNAGETVSRKSDPSPAPATERTLSSAEVDQHMAADPAAKPNLEGEKTWAQQGV